MSPEIFLKVEIWALIFLSLKFCRRFLIFTYPSAKLMLLAIANSILKISSQNLLPMPLHYEIVLSKAKKTLGFIQRTLTDLELLSSVAARTYIHKNLTS